MTPLLRKFFLKLLLLLAIALPVNYVIIEMVFKIAFDAYFMFAYVYFIALISIIQYVLLNILEKRPSGFITNFMGAMAAKIFLSILLELEPTLTIFILSARTLELQNAMNIWISL